ncbi:MAG: ATP-binding protein, partial [Planctomycetes bacterium]|nr:ATP-binding protein [Planctomycetota bacterium]
RHLDGILENLLVKGRRESRAEPVPVDLNAVVDETLKFFEGDLFFKHEVELRVEKAGDLPPVWGLWSDFSQSLQNLVRNALDALRGAPARVLTVRTASDGGGLALEVEDTGAGIAPEHRPRLFEPFFTTKGARGTGLGLFSSRNLLAPYGASLEVEPRTPGTLVRIRIPRAAARERDGR